MNATKTKTEYRIKIYYDRNAENPFTSWDCNFPLIYDGGRNSGEDYSAGGIDNYLSNYLTPGQLIRHQKKLLQLFDNDYLAAEISEAENAAEKINILQDYLYNYIAEGIQNKVEFCELFNIVHYYGNSTGYSQGDWAAVLIVPTPENAARLGYDLEKITPEDLESTFNLFGFWAWGDVYGFEIEEKKHFTKIYEDGETEDGADWEHVDSCWGFYGPDPEENGILEYINFEEYGWTRAETIDKIKDTEVIYQF